MTRSFASSRKVTLRSSEPTHQSQKRRSDDQLAKRRGVRMGVKFGSTSWVSFVLAVFGALVSVAGCGEDNAPSGGASSGGTSSGTSGNSASGGTSGNTASGGTSGPGVVAGPGTFHAGCRIYPNDNPW